MVSPQTHHANSHSHRHNYSNCQIFNCSIEKNQQNSLLPTYDTITHKALFKLNYILSNYSSALKSQQPPIFNLPRVSTTNLLLQLQWFLHQLHNILIISPLQYKNIANIFEPPNPKLLKKTLFSLITEI